MTRYKMIPCAFALAAALSAVGEPGGTSFDFEAISAKRFAGAFDPQRNVLKEKFEGATTNTVRLTLPLPSTNGGVWRVSTRYKLRHLSSGVSPVLFGVTPGPERPIKVLESGAKWGELSVVSKVPPGTGSLRVLFWISKDDKVSFEYKDLSLVDETPRSPVLFKLSQMGNLDGRYAVAEGGCGAVHYYWKYGSAEGLPPGKASFEVSLPSGIEFVDASFADSMTVKTERRADGSSTTAFSARKGLAPGKAFSELRIVVRATGRPGQCGRGGLLMRYAGARGSGQCFEVDAGGLDFFVVPGRKARKPKRYCNGISAGELFSGIGSEAIEGLSRTAVDAGSTFIISKDPKKETLDLWRSLGVRRILPSSRYFVNGFMIGNPSLVPESDRFVAVGVDPKSSSSYRVTHAACPVSVYGGSDFFRTNTVPYMKGFVKGMDGAASNWEPYMFKGKGCMCKNCCSAFAKYIGRPCEEIAAKWPACVMKGGEYFDVVAKFRSLEHAKVVKTLDRIVREATDDESSLGLVPGICWIEMGSWWRPRDFPQEVKPIHYAGSLRWMRPWGPYAAWESDYPYVYTKRKPLCHFVAAQDVRRTVNSDYPEGARPKLMALPQGYQCGHWLSQPEHISMALDSYFFNGWESTVEYYFPRGYDARYWNAFAEATDRAARFEDFVLDGRRADAETSVAPFQGVYATPSRFLSGYLPDYRDVPMLQCVAYDLGGSRIAAVFNFWQKGEAFFTLRANGLKPGDYEVVMEDGSLRVRDDARMSYTAQELAAGVRLSVPAVRTRVFEIRPRGAGKATAKVTDASFDAQFDAARPRLERAAAEDAEYEKANGEPVLDPMPVI